jgi:hypothetical protein
LSKIPRGTGHLTMNPVTACLVPRPRPDAASGAIAPRPDKSV